MMPYFRYCCVDVDIHERAEATSKKYEQEQKAIKAPGKLMPSPPQGSAASPLASVSSASVTPKPAPDAKAQALAAFGSSLLG